MLLGACKSILAEEEESGPLLSTYCVLRLVLDPFGVTRTLTTIIPILQMGKWGSGEIQRILGGHSARLRSGGHPPCCLLSGPKGPVSRELSPLLFPQGGNESWLTAPRAGLSGVLSRDSNPGSRRLSADTCTAPPPAPMQVPGGCP